jgi:DNA-binding winged helix-turn-helix (wHTH) protein/TolB-like protein/Tfp pilus assembly protein PilF
LRDGKAVPLTPKVFDILLVLVQNSGHVLAKDELMKAVWPESFVEEGNLTRNVSTLRTVLGGPDGQQCIETVPKIGYRFVAGVKKVDEAPDLDVEKHFGPQAVMEEEEPSDQDQAEQVFDENGSMAASGFRVTPPEPGSRANQAASENQTLAVPAGAGSVLSKSINNWLRVGLVSLAVLIIATLAYAVFFRRALVARPPEIKSLAVLPLKLLSKDPNDDFLALGLAADIITRISQNNKLIVRPTSAVKKFANREVDSLDAARQLKVDSVLDGTVQRVGDRLHINLNLLSTQDGASLWSDSFNVSLFDILKMQDDVAQQVATRLRLKLRSQTQISSVNPQAYDFYLRAKYHAGLQNETESQAAIALLERAVQIDPNFAAAYAELALEYRNRAFALKPQDKELEERASADAEKALSLDPDLAEAHVARGLLLWTHSNHFPHALAVQEFRRALDLNPNLDEAHHQLASVYNHIGLLDKGEEEIKKAVDINPGNTGARFRVGVNLLYQGRDEQALEAFRDSEKFSPSVWAYQTACALFHLGRKEEVAARVAEALKNNPQDEGGALSSIQALLAASAGDVAASEAKIKRAVELGKSFGHFHHTAYTIACAYALLNKAEPAMKWLQMAADDGFPCYPLFERDPNLNNLRKDPRFITFMASLKDQWERYQATL